MNFTKIVPGKTKLRFNYTDVHGTHTQREGLVEDLRKTSRYTVVVMRDQLRNGETRQFSVNRMTNVVGVTYP
jgi:hypothetical protein